MDLLIPLGIILSAVLVHLIRQPLPVGDALEAQSGEGGMAPLEKRDRLLTDSEAALTAQFQQHYRTLSFFPKVAASTLFMHSEPTLANRGVVDLLVCRREDLTPLCGLFFARALSDEEERRLRALLAAADLPLLRISPSPTVGLEEAQAQMPELFSKPEAVSEPAVTESPAERAPVAKASDAAMGSGRVSDDASASEVKGRLCPKCGKRMGKRRVRKGKHAGRLFWACGDYPACRTLIPYK